MSSKKAVITFPTGMDAAAKQSLAHYFMETTKLSLIQTDPKKGIAVITAHTPKEIELLDAAMTAKDAYFKKKKFVVVYKEED